MSYETVIGLEVHVQLGTATKLFCRCPNRFGEPPNTLTCPVCLGYPGTLPVLNGQAVDLAIRLALALGAEVRRRSVFARKNYFYPDLPKGYQISQFDLPLAENGSLSLTRHHRTARIRRLHLEEDAGKLLHEMPGGGVLSGASLVDFNRCSVPLVEIVSEPDLRAPAEAQDYLQTLRQVLLYTAVSDANMEEGSLRCDANVSIRPVGSSTLGTRSEIKNLNSFRHVAKALELEVARQTRLVESGGEVVQETRTFDADAGVTRPMRGKEESHDYRYFPEPDLPPLILDAGRIEEATGALPELPWDLRERLITQFDLQVEDALTLTATPALAAYLECVASTYPGKPRTVANWLKTEILRELKSRKADVEAAIEPQRLARLLTMVDDGRLSTGAAKRVLTEIWDSDESAAEAAERLGLLQIRDEAIMSGWVRQVVDEHPRQAAEYRAGKHRVAGFFVGRVMQLSEGRAEPRLVQRLLRQALLHEDPMAAEDPAAEDVGSEP
ncbi:MAG: Asp-tRNA(Asn)/Glu-tRNA(Gln) amidotransferase subunit GatB [bacterium]|nr:Asp-tRNA(Asn)/Glu-tRNA(Gln) amidotransferase subunit GatB [bacterium]